MVSDDVESNSLIVVHFYYSLLFLLFFVMFSHASLAEWFLFFAASTLECFLFALSFLFMDATVAPDKEVDSLILELQLLSLSLYIPSFAHLSFVFAFFVFYYCAQLLHLTKMWND